MNPALRHVILEFGSLRGAAEKTGVCVMKLSHLIKSHKEGNLWDEMVASMRVPPTPPLLPPVSDGVETPATLPPTEGFAIPATGSPIVNRAVAAAGVAPSAPREDADPFLTPTSLKAELRSLSTRLGDGRPYGKHGSTGAYREGLKYATRIIAEKGADPVAASKRLREADVTVCAKTLKMHAKQVLVVASWLANSKELYLVTSCIAGAW